MKPIASRITIAVITAGMLVVSSIAPSMMMVYGATNCTATYGEDCYATGMYTFFTNSSSLGLV